MLNQLARTAATILLAATATAGDWPTFRGNNQRTGVATEPLKLPLRQAWIHKTGRPAPAWTAPAKWDAYAGNAGLQPMRDFDRVHHATAAAGRIYYGSTTDFGIHCLDAATGRELWVYLTNGAVRVAPTFHGTRIYAGSDDGAVYCLNAADGALVWTYRPTDSGRFVGNNNALISTAPCRTGVLIHSNLAYCAFSLVPWRPSLLCALDTVTGKPKLTSTLRGVTIQGPLAATDAHMIVLQGKTSPFTVDLKTLKRTTSFSVAGGAWSRILGGAYLATGPNNQKNHTSVVQLHTLTGAFVATLTNTSRILADNPQCFIPDGDRLKTIDLSRFAPLCLRINELRAEQSRKKKAKDKAAVAALNKQIAKLGAERRSTTLRETKVPTPIELVKAGNQIVIGARGAVVVIDAKTGKQLWTAPIQGDARGLAIADGRLIVSTTTGQIYAFQ